MKQLLCFALLAGLAGCAGTLPQGAVPVENFNLDRYLGTWYEIARLDHSFERGLSRATAFYALNEDGSVRVVNRGYQEEKKKWKEAVGKAKFVGERNIGRLKVSFFGPFYGGYNIIEAGTRIGHDPELDRRRYGVTEGGITVVGPGEVSGALQAFSE